MSTAREIDLNAYLDVLKFERTKTHIECKRAVPTETEDRAAEIIADMLPGPLMRRMEETDNTATPLYGREQRAVDWLRSYRERGGTVPLNSWSMSYVRHGPPPWRSRGLE